MEISEANINKLKAIISETYELSNKLPDMINNVLHVNINYRLYILNNWIQDFSKDINYE